MNRPMRERNRGHRSANLGRSFRPAGAVSGPIRLVGGTADPPKRETPPGWNPAAPRNLSTCRSTDRIAANPVFSFRRYDSRSDFLSDRSGQKATHRMWLPSCNFHNLFYRCPPLPFQKDKHLVGFATRSGNSASGRLPFSTRRHKLLSLSGRGRVSSSHQSLRLRSQASPSDVPCEVAK